MTPSLPTEIAAQPLPAWACVVAVLHAVVLCTALTLWAVA